MLRITRLGLRLRGGRILLGRCFYSSLTITDPLVIYENKIAAGTLLRDEAQHRAALEQVERVGRKNDQV